MDVVELPLLNQHQTLEEAAHAMAQTDRRAVVIETSAGEYSIYMNYEIRDARALGKKGLSELGKVARPASRLEFPRIGTAGRVAGGLSIKGVGAAGADLEVPASMPADLSRDIEETLDQLGVSYGVLGPATRLVRVATRHEGLGQEIRVAKKVCTCSQNPKHSAECPPNNTGDSCYCGGTYECY